MPGEAHLEVRGRFAAFYLQLAKNVNNPNIQNSRISVETLICQQVFEGLPCVHSN